MNFDDVERDLPADLRARLDPDDPFKNPPEIPATNIDKLKSLFRKVPTPVETPPEIPAAGRGKSILDNFTPAGHLKFTCTLCNYKFDKSMVKSWWRKPDKGKRPIPICPYCGNAGAGIGHRHDWGEFIPDKPSDVPKYNQGNEAYQRAKKYGNRERG